MTYESFTHVRWAVAAAFFAAACAGGPENGENMDASTPDTTEETDARRTEAVPVSAPACPTRATPEQLADRRSPLDSVSVTLEAQTAKVCYGSPSARGRDIFGGLVPFDTPWRLGANEATVVHMPADGMIAGVPVGAGWFSLYAVPGPQQWEVVVNAEAQRWGIPISPDVRAADVGSATVRSEAVAEPVESLTMRFEESSSTTADLVITWADTRVRVPIRID